MNILIMASENDGIKGGKVGGLGDVIRDVPPALAARGHMVHVVTPSYGFLHRINDSRQTGTVGFMFSGRFHEADLYEVQGKNHHSHIRLSVIEHPVFASQDNRGDHSFYSFDPPDRPFASDATKFALFCMAIAKAVTDGVFGRLDCIHLHDWHMGFFLILRAFHPEMKGLQQIRSVFSIHNLALQGIRPFRNSDSSLEAWYPGLGYNPDLLSDPRWRNCVNPMASAIRLADAVHTVSPAYADEILHPSRQPMFYGGEGLEADLVQARDKHRLSGILNGCAYPESHQPARMKWQALLKLLSNAVIQWCGKSHTVPAAHFIACERLKQLERLSQKPDMVMTTVSRVVEQKLYLMKAPGSVQMTGQMSGLDQLLRDIEGHGVYLFLGAGDPEYEWFLTQMSSRYRHFVFLNGYSEDCAQALYANGDLFVMPSSFEPCGISQMLAMRDGQPCLVHNVGGLKDTVQHGYNGFVFNGNTVNEMVDDFIRTGREAAEIKLNAPDKWKKICRQASDSRFLWEDSIRQYVKVLYEG